MNTGKDKPICCSDCGQETSSDQLRWIDEKPICNRCLFDDAQPVTIWPIGIVVNDKQRKPDAFGTTGSDVSEIHLHPGQARFMAGVADETHLTIVWQLHQQRPIRTVFARGWDGKRVGPFASRTPDRLTPIAITDVELIKVDGTVLTVRSLDAINGTPVLDIKVGRESLKNQPRTERN